MTTTKIKSAASRVGNAIVELSSAMHNAQIEEEIEQIDSQINALCEQMARLQDQRSELEKSLI